MVVLNRLLLNREYVVINALKALPSIISMCDLHVISYRILLQIREPDPGSHIYIPEEQGGPLLIFI
jgi:hypothetical protein